MQKLNYLYYRLKYLNAHKLKLKAPVDVSMELSSFCNLRCPYCYHHKNPPFMLGMMSLERAKLIINECVMNGVHSIKFNWRGESTLNPNYDKILSYAEESASGNILMDRLANTNFNFKPSEKTFTALSTLTKLKVSIDSLDKDVYETQRLRGKFDLITSNIDTFYNYYMKDTQLVLQAVRTKLNYNEDLEGRFKARWPNANISIRDCVDNRASEDSELSHNERDASDRQPCRQAFARIIFAYNGDAYMCCPAFSDKNNGPVQIGNIDNSAMYDIFNSPKALKMREMLRNLKAFESVPICKNCSSFETFKGYKPNFNS